MKTIISELDFLNKKVFIETKGLKKERLLSLANKLIKNVPDPRNAKEHY